VRTGGDRRNRDFAAAHVDTDGVADELEALAYDPQTSGGLLIALAADKGAVLEATFTARGLFVARVGRVVEGAGVGLA
jgi:selenide,water dikinase